MRKIMIIIALMPILNFLHESGHFIGYKVVGANPTMHLQRVEIDEGVNLSETQITVGNWGGPIVNYTGIGLGLALPQMRLIALGFTLQRLSAQVVGVIVYSFGNTRFTNDETYQVKETNRLGVASIALILYFFLGSLSRQKSVF